MFVRSIRLFILIFLASACYTGHELPPDQDIWKYAEPASAGLSEDVLLSLNSRILAGEFEQLNGLMIIKDDRMVFENYYHGSSRQTIAPMGKASLSLTVAAVGIAVDEGLLEISDPIHQYLPDYADLFEEDESKKDITIDHLLKHRSGFAWNETVLSIHDPANHLTQMKASPDWIAFILGQLMEAAPGQRFNMNSGTGIILSKIVEQVTGQSFDDFLKDYLFDPTGMTTVSFSTDPSGNTDGGSGASISLIDWTTFGYLMLKEGIWDGRKIIDPNFVETATSLQSSSSSNINLGYGWWLFGVNFQNAFGIESEGIYFIPGGTGQYIYVIPSHDMVVSIQAENFFKSFCLGEADYCDPSLKLFAEITTSVP